ncbi:hypothetical protein Gpo141_00012477 [Globisporangium polare]
MFKQAEAQQSTTDLVSGGIQIVKEIISAINNLVKKSKKERRQVASWIPPCRRASRTLPIGSSPRPSRAATGAWMRSWRARTAVSQTTTIASGKCEDTIEFSVYDCQNTGKAHC